MKFHVLNNNPLVICPYDTHIPVIRVVDVLKVIKPMILRFGSFIGKINRDYPDRRFFRDDIQLKYRFPVFVTLEGFDILLKETSLQYGRDGVEAFKKSANHEVVKIKLNPNACRHKSSTIIRIPKHTIADTHPDNDQESDLEKDDSPFRFSDNDIPGRSVNDAPGRSSKRVRLENCEVPSHSDHEDINPDPHSDSSMDQFYMVFTQLTGSLKRKQHEIRDQEQKMTEMLKERQRVLSQKEEHLQAQVREFESKEQLLKTQVREFETREQLLKTQVRDIEEREQAIKRHEAVINPLRNLIRELNSAKEGLDL